MSQNYWWLGELFKHLFSIISFWIFFDSYNIFNYKNLNNYFIYNLRLEINLENIRVNFWFEIIQSKIKIKIKKNSKSKLINLIFLIYLKIKYISL